MINYSDIETKRLSEIATIFSGFAFSAADLISTGIPVLKIGNIQDKIVTKQVVSYFPKEKFSNKLSRFVYQSDDTLVAMTGEGSVGKFGRMIELDGEYLVNQRVGVIRPDKEKVNPFFLYYVLTLPQYEEALYQLGVGAGQPNVSPKDVGRLFIPYPPLPTQQRIASILSAYDELIEVNNQRIKLLEQTARELYKEWFVRMRFPGYKQAKFKKGIPEGWEVVRIDNLYKTSSGGTPLREKIEYYENGIYEWIKTGELNDSFVLDTKEKITEKGLKNSSAKLFPPYTTIFAMYGNTIGQLGITTKAAATNQAACALLPLTKEYDFEFIFLTMLHYRETIIGLGMGAAQQNVSQDELKKFKILKPIVEIAIEFKRIVNPLFQQIEILQQQITQLRQIRDRLLPRLISGKLQV